MLLCEYICVYIQIHVCFQGVILKELGQGRHMKYI